MKKFKAPRTAPSATGALVPSLLAAAFLTSLPGCGPPSLDSPEYGEVLSKMPEVPGSEKPYPLPELQAPEPPTADVPSEGAPPAEPAVSEPAGK